MSGGDGTFVAPRRAWRGVRVIVTHRGVRGHSKAPYDRCNLGMHVGDDPLAVARNRADVAALAALPSAPAYLDQTHGIDVAERDGTEPAGPVPQADAALTRRPGVVLAVLTADCLPIVLAARDASAVAVVHAGWRGLAAGIVERAVSRLELAPGALRAYIGPAISAANYEVGDEVRAALQADAVAAGGGFAATRPGHWSCDLPALAAARLLELGVTDVETGAPCTYADPRFYSHRRDGVTGRFATYAWIEP